MFSVVIPVYNKALYVNRAIRSVVDQTEKRIEIIIINDGSTDNSLEVISNFRDNRIKIINQENKGEGEARNIGIKLSSKKFICFLDADDMWLPFFLEEISFLIKDNPYASLFATAFIIKNKNNYFYYKPKIKFNYFCKFKYLNYFYSLSRNNHPISSSSICVNRDIFNFIGLFDNSLKIGTDIDMWIRICSAGAVAYSSKFCAIYYKDAENRSTDQDKLDEKRIFYLLKIINSNIPCYSSKMKTEILRFVAIKLYEIAFSSRSEYALQAIIILESLKKFLPINLLLKYNIRKYCEL